VGVFEEYDLPELMRRLAVEIPAFVAAHEDELFETDYRAMQEAKLATKKPRGGW